MPLYRQDMIIELDIEGTVHLILPPGYVCVCRDLQLKAEFSLS